MDPTLPYQIEDVLPVHLAEMFREHWPVGLGHDPPAICEKHIDRTQRQELGGIRGREVGGQGCLGRERCVNVRARSSGGGAGGARLVRLVRIPPLPRVGPLGEVVVLVATYLHM